jgi:tetratricopeptide (TPR) repeat protein
MTHRTPSLRRVAAAAALSVALTVALAVPAAPAWAQAAPAKSFAEMVKGVALLPEGRPESELLIKVSEAVGHIQKMDLPRAQAALNEALQLDARSAQLHLLNVFIYHLQAKQGDTQKAEIAIEGYQQALRIDPANWIAQEFLGLAHMDLKQFAQAKTRFAEVLLLTPDSPVSVEGLMVSSYLTGDAATACAMADQLHQGAEPARADAVRSSIAVYAACGHFERARQMRELLSARGGNALDLERSDRRLAQWRNFYRKQEEAAVLVKTRLTAADDGARPQQLAQAFTVPTLTPRPAATAPEPVAAPSPPPPAPAPASLPAPPSPSPQTTPAPAEPPAGSEASGPRMLLVDVVLLSTQELISTSKGVNLLNALTLQLGGNGLAAYSRSHSTSIVGDAAAAVTTAITRAVTIPALSYSLNIANANSSVNEVLARPTLAAIEGLPSEFFSGTNLSAGVVSTSQQGGTTIVPLDKRFGIKLAVTPTFLSQGRVQLKVEAQRTALNASAENNRVAYQIEIGETTANANVVMNVGDTLVLSGLSEKSSSNTRDGVPGLQDVPMLQYMFSNKKTNDIQRSVLILVTPRWPSQVAEGPNTAAAEAQAAQMKALREKFSFNNLIPPNVEAVMQQMRGNDFFREFRQGDVSMERWDRMRTTGDRLREALDFLYY